VAKVFKQKSNKVVAFAFAGLILVSQLMVLNMGYSIPWYFLVVLIILCATIIWGMLVNDCILDNELLMIKSGPFSNKIEVNKIERLIKDSQSLFKGKNAAFKLTIVYNRNRRISIFPIEKDQLIQALKKANRNIEIT